MMDAPFHEFVEALAARTPAPGGGAAAACTGTMGVALVTMVLRFASGRKGAEALEPVIRESLAKLDAIQKRMLPMGDRDMSSFELVAAAYKLPLDTDQAKIVRTRAIQEALGGAMVVPEELLHLSRDALHAADLVTAAIHRSVASDFGAGAELLLAAARTAELIVRTNARYLHDRELARAATGRAAELLFEANDLRDKIAAVVEERIA